MTASRVPSDSVTNVRSAVPSSTEAGLAEQRARRRANGSASARLPSRPTTVVAVSRLVTTASSVASTAAAKNGSRSRPVSGTPGAGWSRGARNPVASARKISPLPWVATLPVRASPSPARRASRVQPAASTGASVTRTTMHEPAGRAAGSTPARRSAAPTGRPPTVSRSCSPKLVSTTAPRVCPDGSSRDAVPMPPLWPRQVIPVPAPTEPSSGGVRLPADARAAARAARTSSLVTWVRRLSLRCESSHSATSGRTTSSTPIVGSSSTSSSHAASSTLPTCIVEVRKTGVSASPHSCSETKPVHSPAPLSTAPPAGTGERNSCRRGR